MRVVFNVNYKLHNKIIETYKNFIEDAEGDQEEIEYYEKILSDFEENGCIKAVDLPFRPNIGDIIDAEWLGLRMSDSFSVDEIWISDIEITAILRYRSNKELGLKLQS